MDSNKRLRNMHMYSIVAFIYANKYNKSESLEREYLLRYINRIYNFHTGKSLDKFQSKAIEQHQQLPLPYSLTKETFSSMLLLSSFGFLILPSELKGPHLLVTENTSIHFRHNNILEYLKIQRLIEKH